MATSSDVTWRKDVAGVDAQALMAMATMPEAKALVLLLALDDRSSHLRHVIVVLPESAPAEQCNRFMAEYERDHYVERVEISADAVTVQVIDVALAAAMGVEL